MATDATRGAGRPEATHLIEVMIEQLAAELGLDPLEVRRKNFIPKEDFPAEVALGLVYDSGDYHGSLDKLLTHVDVDAFRREQAELRERGHLPRHRLLDLDGDLRPGAVARRRPERRRPAGRLLRVLDRARPRLGLGHRLQRHLAARPGPRHVVRADRRRPRRRHARRRRRHARRHRHRPVRPRHLRLALARRRRRVARQARRSRWPTRPSGSRRTCSRRRPEDIELAGRQVLGARLAGQGPDAGRDRRRGVRAREPARRHGAGAGGDDVLRPGELRVPVRRARLHRRRRRRDRQGRRRALRRGRRLRPGDQPDADRGPDPRRHRARASARRCSSGSTTTTTASS